MSAPSLTVLVINHDCARFLAEALDSVLAQDWPGDDMEILLVDDGSTDDSEAVAKPYLGRLAWLPKKNGGAVSAFNYGFARARGEFIAILESDDAWTPDKLSRSIALLKANPKSAMLQHWLTLVDTEGRPLPGHHYPTGPDSVTLDELMDRGLPMTPLSGAVIRRALIAPFVPFPEKFFYGHDICLRLCSAIQAPIAVLPVPLGTRRIHESNLFGETIYDSARKLEKALTFHNELAAWMRDFLAAHGRTINPAVMRETEIARWLMELFLRRYQGRWLASLDAWRRVMSLYGWRPYTLLFKAPTLLLAVASPRYYLAFQKLYANTPMIAARRRVLTT
jgi:glycosyltransferase involved in cell wall biosynthesis